MAMLAGCDSKPTEQSTAMQDAQSIPARVAPPIRDVSVIATARYGIPIDKEAVPAPIARVIDSDLRQSRNYPMQPPLIPHDIRGYDVNLQANRCMACHARSETRDTQAPMISVTHYMDRQGNFLAEISPRRYFCDQCHVVQTDSVAIVDNSFVDMGEILLERVQTEAGKSK